MDTAKHFQPDTILLWDRLKEHPRARRLLQSMPAAEVRFIKHQRNQVDPGSTASALLRSKKTVMIGTTSSFVKQFTGRPGPGIGCRPYYKLVSASNGCPYWCTYCYLAFVYRKHAPYIKLNINYETMFKQIRKTVSRTTNSVSFNMGEMLDSLALDHITNLTRKLVPFFAGMSNGFLMLLTKSSNIDNLLAVKPNPQTVVSWSLNSSPAICEHEPGTADLDERILAASKCQRHGYRIRYRIDPAILHHDWQNAYNTVIQKALSRTRPENITLGMLRFVPGHQRLAAAAYPGRGRRLFADEFVGPAGDGKLRYPVRRRLEFYKFAIDTIRKLNRKVTISLCRETSEVREKLRHSCHPRICNCIP